jgi:hypothetical protein
MNFLEPFSRWGVTTFSWLLKIAARPQASLLNRALYQPARSIPSQQLAEVRERLRVFGKQRGLDQEVIETWMGHAQRLILSRNWLEEYLSHLSTGAKVLDLGPPSLATDYWKAEFPDLTWSNTDWDLRYPWPLSSDSVELICCTELIEHLSDPPNEIHNEGFYQTGFRDMLLESCRVLVPGGIFFGTTPNAASIFHLDAILNGQPPWFFTVHVREYTKKEISYRFSEAGLKLIAVEDVHCLTVNNWIDYRSHFTQLLSQRLPTKGRGDDLFFVAQKPDF